MLRWSMLRARHIDWVAHFLGHLELHWLICLSICVRRQTFVDVFLWGLHLSFNHNVSQPRVNWDTGRSFDHLIWSILQLRSVVLFFLSCRVTFDFKRTRAFWFVMNWELGRFADFLTWLPCEATESSCWVVWVQISVTFIEDRVLGEHARAHDFNFWYSLAHLD